MYNINMYNIQFDIQVNLKYKDYGISDTTRMAKKTKCMLYIKVRNLKKNFSDFQKEMIT